jgi:hypothetical protein
MPINLHRLGGGISLESFDDGKPGSYTRAYVARTQRGITGENGDGSVPVPSPHRPAGIRRSVVERAIRQSLS